VSIIKQHREKLGYTQNELANETGLSLRTIQRLESNNKSPKGHTLKVLTDVFEMEPAVLQASFLNMNQTRKSELHSIRLINLSVLAFIGIPFGNLIVPTILWRKRRDSQLVDDYGRRIINCQILWSVILSLLLCISPFINLYEADFPLILIILFAAMTINVIIVGVTARRLQNENLEGLNLPIRFI